MAISLSEFVKFYPLRSKGLAWLFGAGSSVSAGVPSAYDLIWDFKRRIYCAEQGYPLSIFNNLTDNGIREQIQSYFDSQSSCPKFDSTEEYSYYFERAFKSAKDRSEYISQQTSGMQLSYGHKVMGVLMKHQHLNLIFTTNFDKAFENVASNYLAKLEDWYCSDLDNGSNGMRFFQAGKRPLIVKLHGDYFSDRLKNTEVELQHQDEKLQNIFELSLDTHGLCIMGYSGRDQSIMELLERALNKPNSYPNGIYWFIKEGTEPLPQVKALLEKAKSLGKDAELVEIITFDTAWADIIKGFNNLPYEDIEKLDQNFKRLVNTPIPLKGNRYPLLRLNAIPIAKYPAIARLYKCEAGNTKEIKELIAISNSSILAVRKSFGIVGFGPDLEFTESFKNYGNYELDIYSISTKDILHDDSSIQGLLTSAILKALIRNKPLKITKRRDKNIIFPNPKEKEDRCFEPFKKVSPIFGKIPNSDIYWVIGLEVKIQYALSLPYLLLSPTVIASKPSKPEEAKLIAPFVKEITAGWYNKQYNSLIDIWLDLFFNGEKEVTIYGYEPEIIGINPEFKLKRTTAYTKSI